MDKNRIEYLLHKHLNKTLDGQERAEFEFYLDNAPEEELYNLIDRTLQSKFKESTFDDSINLQRLDDIFNQDRNELQSHSARKRWLSSALYVLAAVMLMFVAFTVYFYRAAEPDVEKVNLALKQQIIPAGNKAVLTLYDGTDVQLDSSNGDFLMNQEGIQIKKTANNQLIYSDSTHPSLPGSNKAVRYNTLRTPKGGHYRVVLSDGSVVWLNAESTLKYPVSFRLNERRVEVEGEAYFEIAKNEAVPFIVASKGQDIKVLGTHFNVNTYKYNAIQTTLLEGSIEIVRHQGVRKKLRPGQKSIVDSRDNSSTIKVELADFEKDLSWKNGVFVFKGQSLEEIMEEVSRWYDVTVVFQNENAKKQIFSGSMSRFENITQLLEVFETTGLVNFRIEGRRVLIMT